MRNVLRQLKCGKPPKTFSWSARRPLTVSPLSNWWCRAVIRARKSRELDQFGNPPDKGLFRGARAATVGHLKARSTECPKERSPETHFEPHRWAACIYSRSTRRLHSSSQASQADFSVVVQSFVRPGQPPIHNSTSPTSTPEPASIEGNDRTVDRCDMSLSAQEPRPPMT
jgi:hypothetical protein